MAKQFLLFFFLLTISQSVFAQDFYDFGIRDIRITFEEKNWEKKLNYYKSKKPDSRLIGTIMVDGVKYDSIGVRYKGNSSFNNVRRSERKKLPINIKLDYVIKKQSIDGKYTAIKLSNGFRDPSFVREPLAYELARQYMPASKSNFARVYVNDQYMGLYVNTESVDEHFIERNFDSKDGGLFKCDPDDWDANAEAKGCTKSKEASLAYLGADPDCYKVPYELKEGDDEIHYLSLIKLIKALKTDITAVEKILDIDQVLWMLAFNNLTVNLDSYNGYLSHNYYLYEDTVGIFHPILWDMNMCYGGFRYDGTKIMDSEELIQMHPLSGINDENRPLIYYLLRDPFYKKMYLHHLRVMTEDYLQKGKYKSRAEEMMRYIDQTVKDDAEKLYGYDDFQNNLTKTVSAGKTPIIGLTELLDNRTKFLNEQKFMQASLPQISDQGLRIVGDSVIFQVKVNSASQVILAHRKGKIGRFSYQNMHDDGKNGDSKADDSIFSYQLKKADLSQYYFIAEEPENISTLPARASFDYLKIQP